MNDLTEIPKGSFDTPGPCWRPREYAGKACKPTIRCKCGKWCYIGLHHVHADGTVTRSFYDSEATSFTENGKTYAHSPGCGWHVWLKLMNYSDGDFPPEN